MNTKDNYVNNRDEYVNKRCGTCRFLTKKDWLCLKAGTQPCYKKATDNGCLLWKEETDDK